MLRAELTSAPNCISLLSALFDILPAPLYQPLSNDSLCVRLRLVMVLAVGEGGWGYRRGVFRGVGQQKCVMNGEVGPLAEVWR